MKAKDVLQIAGLGLWCIVASVASVHEVGKLVKKFAKKKGN